MHPQFTADLTEAHIGQRLKQAAAENRARSVLRAARSLRRRQRVVAALDAARDAALVADVVELHLPTVNDDHPLVERGLARVGGLS